MSEAPQAALERLRAGGAAQADPGRLRALEALARRLQEQPEPVRRLLEDRLQAGVADLSERLAQRQQAAQSEAEQALARHPAIAAALRRLQALGDLRGIRRLAAAAERQGLRSPLAQLNEAIRQQRAERAGATLPGDAPEQDELASVRRFREAWNRNRTLTQVEQAAARKPAQAGPLNSHVLVLQSLHLMRELSPAYLRHFLAHVESLQWLDEARQQVPRDDARPAKAGKPARRSPRRK